MDVVDMAGVDMSRAITQVTLSTWLEFIKDRALELPSFLYIYVLRIECFYSNVPTIENVLTGLLILKSD